MTICSCLLVGCGNEEVYIYQHDMGSKRVYNFFSFTIMIYGKFRITSSVGFNYIVALDASMEGK